MYKKLISGILVVAVLNLIGCYSSNNITLDELKNYKDNNRVIITTTDNNEYTLRRDSTTQYYSDWKFVDDKLEWTEGKVRSQKDNPRLKKFTIINTTIAESEISNIVLEEFNTVNTILLSVGILVFMVGIAFKQGFDKLKLD